MKLQICGIIMAMANEEKLLCRLDQRVEVKLTDQTSPPFKWICALQCYTRDECACGTGFKINFPRVNYSVVLTAAHNLWDKDRNKFVDSVTLKFPEEPSFEVHGSNLYKPDEYRLIDDSNYDSNHDYGLIFYRNERTTSDGFGWTTQISDEELLSLTLIVSGFSPETTPPAPLPQIGNIKMKTMEAKIKNVHQYKLDYLNDTTSGQSGSPVYYQSSEGNWIAVGIHIICGADNENHNSGRRLDLQVIARFARVMDCRKALQSVRNAQAHICCERYSRQLSNGGSVNCQYDALGNSDKFYIYPVAMPSSLATADILLQYLQFVIESVHHTNYFIRMTYNSMEKKYREGGGGKIQILYFSEYKITKKEQFYLHKKSNDDDVYSFICVDYPHYRIRVGAEAVTQNKPGAVNCQYYETPTEKSESYTEIEFQNARENEEIRIVNIPSALIV